MTPPSLRSLFRRVPREAVASEPAVLPADVEAAIDSLELEMPDLQLRHRDVFSHANAWAERYDAVLAATPEAHRDAAEARLQSLGARWGVAHGARVTGAFPAIQLPA